MSKKEAIKKILISVQEFSDQLIEGREDDTREPELKKIYENQIIREITSLNSGLMRIIDPDESLTSKDGRVPPHSRDFVSARTEFEEETHEPDFFKGKRERSRFSLEKINTILLLGMGIFQLVLLYFQFYFQFFQGDKIGILQASIAESQMNVQTGALMANLLPSITAGDSKKTADLALAVLEELNTGYSRTVLKGLKASEATRSKTINELTPNLSLGRAYYRIERWQDAYTTLAEHYEIIVSGMNEGEKQRFQTTIDQAKNLAKDNNFKAAAKTLFDKVN